MKTCKIGDRIIKLKNEEYYQLLDRFDVTKSFNGAIYKSCPLCNKYVCRKCPAENCDKLILKCGNIRIKKFKLLPFVSWIDKTGRNQIKRIHKFLLENFK
jgi:hypothetical protein